MKSHRTTPKLALLGCMMLFSLPLMAQPSADELVKRADQKMRGEKSSISTMTMQVIRPGWTRTLSFKSWTLGTNFSMVLITAPAKEKGQSFLKRNNEMWNWNPSINRIIKLPPSMLAQGWMGSDYTNDDLLNQSSIVNAYTHKITGSATLSGRNCIEVTLIPKADAAVVWGKVILWITPDDFLLLKSTYYDEDGMLVKTETASEIKQMSGRNLPTRFELVPADKPGNRTVISMDAIQFDVALQESYFSQQNLQKVR